MTLDYSFGSARADGLANPHSIAHPRGGILRHVPIFESNRRFEVVKWSAGHGGLLLRSRPVDESPDRIELWFKPANMVCLPVDLNGLTIDDADEETNADARRVMGRDMKPSENGYLVVTGDGARGWVVGGSVNGRSDTKPFDAPPMFDGWEPSDGVRTLFVHNVRT